MRTHAHLVAVIVMLSIAACESPPNTIASDPVSATMVVADDDSTPVSTVVDEIALVDSDESILAQAESMADTTGASGADDNPVSPNSSVNIPKNKRNGNPYSVAIPTYRRNTEKYGKKNSCIGHRFEKHQYARACFVLSSNGQYKTWSKFTNNKKVDGDHFFSVFAFKDAAGRTVFATRHEAGINSVVLNKALGRKGAEDVYRYTRDKVEPAEFEKIRYMTVAWGRINTKDDQKIADAIEKLFKAIASDTSGTGKDSTAKDTTSGSTRR